MSKRLAREYDSIKRIITQCPNERTQALMAFQFACCCRIGELLPYAHKPYHFHPDDKALPRKERRKVMEETYQTQGLLKSKITIETNYIAIELPVFKNHSTKIVLVPRKETWITDIMLNWLNKSGEQVFPIHEALARQLMREKIALNEGSHQLRHARTTWLADIVNPYELQEIRGDKDLKTSAIYVTTNPKKTLEKIDKAIEKAAEYAKKIPE